MKTNKQGKIKIPKSGFKRSRFNWSHDVNTTFSWGEIQPTQCKMLIPGSKTTMSAQSLIRLAPMVAPTFGRVKYKTYNQFVSMAEIMPNFDAMMAQEPVTTAGGTKVPQSLPNVSLGILSSWCLQGARATLYFADNATDAGLGKYRTWHRDNPVDTTGANYLQWKAHADHLSNGNVFDVITDAWNSSSNGVLPNINGVEVRLGRFGSAYSAVFGSDGKKPVILAAKSIADLCPVKRSFSSYPPIPDYCKEVTIEGADLVLTGSYTYATSQTEYFALALEFSDFGKRIRKILQGCGYQIDITNKASVSILPLLATYKAYFDIFGLELYQGWETTYCSKLIKQIENGFLENVNNYFMRPQQSSLSNVTSYTGILFIMNELSNCWYTDDVDYVSAHINKLGVSPKVQLSDGAFVNYGSTGDLSTTDHISDYYNAYGTDLVYESQNEAINTAVTGDALMSNNYGTAGAHGVINTQYHNELDAEILKRMYKWTNRNTILGRRIAEILRAQGLGKYVDECKSNYIGSTDTLITISDVVSTSDTKSGSDGAYLGEYGGKGLQYTNEKTLVFENDSYGYWITLACVVPESGYTQGVDTTLTSLTKMSLYNPDFDALGMEATPKMNIISTNYVVGDADKSADTFGFIPRYSKFKVCGNLVNGDFNRHSTRNTYLPYTLDKQMNVNDYYVGNENYVETSAGSLTYMYKSARTNDLPVAGNTWRYPTKYSWLGNFNRIFINTGWRDDQEITPSATNEVIGWSDYNEDNFLSHNIYDVQCYAPMKPIVDSYGLEEPNPDYGHGAEFVSKA